MVARHPVYIPAVLRGEHGHGQLERLEVAYGHGGTCHLLCPAEGVKQHGSEYGQNRNSIKQLISVNADAFLFISISKVVMGE